MRTSEFCTWEVATHEGHPAPSQQVGKSFATCGRFPSCVFEDFQWFDAAKSPGNQLNRTELMQCTAMYAFFRRRHDVDCRHMWFIPWCIALFVLHICARLNSLCSDREVSYAMRLLQRASVNVSAHLRLTSGFLDSAPLQLQLWHVSHPDLARGVTWPRGGGGGAEPWKHRVERLTEGKSMQLIYDWS